MFPEESISCSQLLTRSELILRRMILTIPKLTTVSLRTIFYLLQLEVSLWLLLIKIRLTLIPRLRS
jgi:hypothetical protein